MKVINFGSICIDNVYSVPYFVKPGETLPCTDYEIHPGGKGLNQSLALAKAGANVWHAGRVGQDGTWLVDVMNKAGVDTSLTSVADGPTGHANIQVTPAGENAIVIFGGANRTIGADDVDGVLACADAGDYLLLQNEISSMPTILERAHDAGMKIAFNAAPITAEVLDYPLEAVDIFIINEVEGEALSSSPDPDEIIDRLLEKYPQSSVTLTLGSEGVRYGKGDDRIRQQAFHVDPVDTTAAGDTFTGYFLAELLAGKEVEESMIKACKAASICVTRAGAATSIPDRSELD